MSCNDNVCNICNLIYVDDVQLFLSIAQACSQGGCEECESTSMVPNGPQFGTLFCQSQNEMGHNGSKCLKKHTGSFNNIFQNFPRGMPLHHPILASQRWMKDFGWKGVWTLRSDLQTSRTWHICTVYFGKRGHLYTVSPMSLLNLPLGFMHGMLMRKSTLSPKKYLP